MAQVCTLDQKGKYKDFIHRRNIPQTALNLLQKRWAKLRCSANGDKKNSNFEGRGIKLYNVKRWVDFFTVEEIETTWESDTELKNALTRILDEKEEGSCMTGEPQDFRCIISDESSLEAVCPSLQDQVNVALLVCAKAKTGTEDPLRVVLDKGGKARWISPNSALQPGGGKLKKPDFAGFEFNPSDKYRDPKTIFNRIPGDAKISRKFCHEMLPPDGKRYQRNLKNAEVQKVLNQIHFYMDMHEARYGYVITDQELICFRRRDEGWGELDVGPPIRHYVDVDRKTNSLNSKYVLFHLHHVIANDRSQWHLRSFGRETGKKSLANLARTEVMRGLNRGFTKGCYWPDKKRVETKVAKLVRHEQVE